MTMIGKLRAKASHALYTAAVAVAAIQIITPMLFDLLLDAVLIGLVVAAEKARNGHE